MNMRDKELLDMLSEECAEVIQIVQKINRHGLFNYHPDTEEVNSDALIREMTDVLAVIDQVMQHVLKVPIGLSEIEEAWEKKLKYSHHQEVAR